jgi:hypothetical protein
MPPLWRVHNIVPIRNAYQFRITPYYFPLFFLLFLFIIENKLNQSRKSNISFTKHIENQLNLTKQQMVLLKNFLDKESFNNIEILAKTIKKFPLQLTDLAPI